MASIKSEKPEILEEIEWIRTAQKDPADFEKLFNAYFSDIFNYVLRRIGDVELARDITANTFLNALDNIKSFRWQGIRFSSWLFRIATNEINQNYRKTKRLVPLTQEMSRTFKEDAGSDTAVLQAEEQAAQNEKFKKMHIALSQLKVKYQTVLALRYFENKSLKEIAEILALSENTVKTHIRRGLIELRKML